MLATSATDKRIFIWRLQVLDFFSDNEDGMFAEPRVEVMFSVGAAPVPVPLSSSVNLRVAGSGLPSTSAPDSSANLLDSTAAAQQNQ